MKVEVRNLGILRQAEFSLGGLTVMCGRNNTGKTYATYALYSFLDGWRANMAATEITRIADRKLEELMRGGVTRIDLEEYVQNIDELMRELCKSYTKSLPSIFATVKERFQETSFMLHLDEDRISESTRSLSFERVHRGGRKRPIFSASKTEQSMDLEVSLLVEKSEVELPDRVVKRLIAEAINEIVFARFLPKVFISSAERTGAVMFRRELNLSRNRLLRQLSQADDNVDPRELLLSSYDEYALPVEDNVVFARELEDNVKRRSFIAEEYPDVLERLTEIVGGEYKVARGLGLHFTPHGTRLKLNMGESGSAVRSMLDIVIYLRHKVERGDILMVDEPEMNLHPENQRRMARLFARLVNLGIKVFITTHSDYIVKELNTLIMLNHDDPHLKEIAAREGYDESELIAPESVKVYVAEKGLVRLDGYKKKIRCHTLTEADVDPRMGIEVRAFDETIDKMNEIQQDIVWGGRE